MLRIVLVLGLVLSLILLVGSMTATWQEEEMPAAGVTEKERPDTAPERRKPDLYPPVPASLPDLNRGYVFNEARSLAEEQENGEGPAEPLADATLDEASYIGSVISGERRIGIIVYAEKTVPQPMAVTGRGRGRPVVGAQQLENKHARLVPGETFGGYTVADVLPDRIVFEKNGRKVEKLLTEDKERKSPPPQVQSARRPPRRSSPVRVVSPRRQPEPPARGPVGIGSEPGRPVMPEPPQPPGAVIQNRPPHRVRGVQQPSG